LFFVAQFWENQPPIHRREHSPEPSACELNLKEIGRIVREHCHAVAARATPNRLRRPAARRPTR
jgi:hypothetical protein